MVVTIREAQPVDELVALRHLCWVLSPCYSTFSEDLDGTANSYNLCGGFCFFFFTWLISLIINTLVKIFSPKRMSYTFSHPLFR